MTTDNDTSISKTSGIYRISNLYTGACYIGQASNLRVRNHDHLYRLNKGNHTNRHLRHAYIKYGKDAFLFVVIELCPTESLTEREQHWMEWCKERKIELYNLCPAAGSALGREVLPETRAKLSAINKGKKHSAEELALMSASHKGKPLSPQHRANIIAGHQNSSPEIHIRSAQSLSRTYAIVCNRFGHQYAVRNCSRFCRDYELHNSSLCRVISGKKPCHKGYTGRPMTSDELAKYTPFLIDKPYMEIADVIIQLPLFLI